MSLQHPSNIPIGDLTPEQIAEVNTTMPGLHGCVLRVDLLKQVQVNTTSPGRTWLERLPLNSGVAIDLYPARTLDDAWNLARAIHQATTAPELPAKG